MTSLTITLPLPPKAVRPNARVHWAAKAKATAGYRLTAKLRAREAIKGQPPMWVKASMKVVAYFPTAKALDPGNLMASLKAAEDGLQDAGVIANDKGLWPERPTIRKDAINPRIEITILRED